MRAHSIPHTRRTGSLDNRPILWSIAGGVAAWLLIWAAWSVLSAVVLMIGGAL